MAQLADMHASKSLPATLIKRMLQIFWSWEKELPTTDTGDFTKAILNFTETLMVFWKLFHLLSVIFSKTGKLDAVRLQGAIRTSFLWCIEAAFSGNFGSLGRKYFLSSLSCSPNKRTISLAWQQKIIAKSTKVKSHCRLELAESRLVNIVKRSIPQLGVVFNHSKIKFFLWATKVWVWNNQFWQSRLKREANFFWYQK